MQTAFGRSARRISIRDRFSKDETRAAFLFLSPWLLGFFGLTLFPIGASFYLSFTEYDLLTPPVWNGLDNFVRMFHDPRFVKTLQVTATYVVLGVPLSLTVALGIAAMLNKGINGIRLFRALYYTPTLFGGSVAIALLWRQMFGRRGAVNGLLALFGIEGLNWVGDPRTALYTLVVLRIWQFGASMVIFLAALKQVPNELYESADIDGASRVAKFTRITLPMISPIIMFNLIMQIIASFQAFTPAYVISGGTGGPIDSTLFYTLYLYQRGFTFFQMGYAAGLAWVLLVIISIVTFGIFKTSGRWVFYRG
jgi:multiple sugar transport system permease protein